MSTNNQACWKVDENDEATTSRNQAKTDRNHNFAKKLWTERYKERPKKSTDLVLSSDVPAVYIDLDVSDEDDDTKEYSRWSELPDLLLERIFGYLTIRQKYYASLVCRTWYRAFHLPWVWRSFTLEDDTLTRSRFNYYSGWQYVLDHMRTSMCLTKIGTHIKDLTIKPMFNFYNLYEFMNILSWYAEQEIEKENVILGIGRNIRSLKFTFPCNMTTREDIERIRLFGTGGKLLAALKRLMGNLKKLQRLELIDLMLDPKEAQFLLDELCQTCGMTLRSLKLINTTKVQYQILHVGVFLNLYELHISPQNLGDDLVELLSYTNLKHLHIIKNRYTADDVIIKPVSPIVWKNVRQHNMGLHVHLEVKSNKYKAILWQENAPVRSVVYDSPHIQCRTDSVLNAIDYYKNDLRIYGHKNIPRFHKSKSFTDRIDESLLMLIRQCPYLSTLVVTERVSTSTVLLIAFMGKNLKWLHIRGNAVILKCDWNKNYEWTNEFYTWLKTNCRSYANVENEVSQIFGYKWRFLSDKEFKNLCVNLHDF